MGIQRKCIYCEGIANLIIEMQERIFRKEKVNIFAHFYKCSLCNNSFVPEDYVDINTVQILNQYRIKFKIPFPEELTKVRINYGLSSMKMSKFLGLGSNVYRSYENGEIPLLSIALLLQYVLNPILFKQLVNSKRQLEPEILTIPEFDNLIKKIEELEIKSEICSLDSIIIPEYRPSSLSGFRMFDSEKFGNVVLFFLNKFGSSYRTYLNKLLFYADFFNFKKTGYSITGMVYQANHKGPVPYRYDLYYAYLKEKGFLIAEEEQYDDNIVEKLSSNAQKKFNIELFKQEEVDSLCSVYERFKNEENKNLIHLSHDEFAWSFNKDNLEKIDYQMFAFYLKHM